MTNDLYINGYDAYTEFGMSFEGRARVALLTPPALKDPIVNKSRVEHGTRYITGNSPKVEERSLDLAFHIVAASEADFLYKYEGLCRELEGEELTLVTRQKPDTYYHLIYRSCTQYEEYNGTMAKFVLRVIEPNPKDRTRHDEDTQIDF